MPSTLWAGVEISSSLQSLHEQIRDVCRPESLVEKRTFYPHITLARLKGVSPVKLNALFDEMGDFQGPAFMVREFQLISSILKPEGPMYTTEAVYEF
jgi:2'-5' RNA ligase